MKIISLDEVNSIKFFFLIHEKVLWFFNRFYWKFKWMLTLWKLKYFLQRSMTSDIIKSHIFLFKKLCFYGHLSSQCFFLSWRHLTIGLLNLTRGIEPIFKTVLKKICLHKTDFFLSFFVSLSNLIHCITRIKPAPGNHES